MAGLETHTSDPDEQWDCLDRQQTKTPTDCSWSFPKRNRQSDFLAALDSASALDAEQTEAPAQPGSAHRWLSFLHLAFLCPGIR